MKVAVVGCGSMGNRRIRHVRQLAAGEAVGYDIRPDRRAQVESRHGIRTVESVDKLTEERPDALMICVPPAAHMSYLELAVKNGWHFMCENPVSHALDGLDGLLDGVTRRELVSHIGSNMRFHSSVRKLKELLVRNAIGRVVAGIVEAGEWLPDWHPYEPYTDYYPSSRAMGGGLDAICDLEWIIDLFGPVSRVACLAGKRTTLEIDTDDVVQMLIEFRSGPQVVLHTDMVQRVYAHKAKFIGEEGTLVWDWHRRRVSCYQARSGKWEHLEDDVVDPKERTSMDLKPGWEWVEPMYLEDSRVFFARAERHDCSTDSLLEGIKNLKLILEALECSNQSRVWSNPEFR